MTTLNETTYKAIVVFSLVGCLWACSSVSLEKKGNPSSTHRQMNGQRRICVDVAVRGEKDFFMFRSCSKGNPVWVEQIVIRELDVENSRDFGKRICLVEIDPDYSQRTAELVEWAYGETPIGFRTVDCTESLPPGYYRITYGGAGHGSRNFEVTDERHVKWSEVQQ